MDLIVKNEVPINAANFRIDDNRHMQEPLFERWQGDWRCRGDHRASSG